MENITLNTILNWTKGRYQGPAGQLGTAVTEIITDSRQVTPGSLFAAIPGEQRDGHDFCGEAQARGAVCCLVQKPIAQTPAILVTDTLAALGQIAQGYRLSFPQLRLLAVTGSAGKTTAKEMLAAVLGQRFSLLKTPGNFNNALGLPLTLFQLAASQELAVIELGISGFGEMEALAEIARPDLAFYTNIGDAHLEALGDRAGVLKAKSALLDALPKGASVYLNGDDPWLRKIRQIPGVEQRWYGLGPGNDLQVRAAEVTAFSCQGRLTGQGLDLPIQLNAGGRYLLATAAGAALAALDLGLNPEEIRAGLAAFRPLRGRGELIDCGEIRVIDHSYNANPNSMAAALDALSRLPGRRVAILGDMYELGDNWASLHWQTGAYAAGHADLVLAVGELAEQLALGAAAQNQAPAAYFTDQAALLAALPELIRPGDAVLVKASHSARLEETVAQLKALYQA